MKGNKRTGSFLKSGIRILGEKFSYLKNKTIYSTEVIKNRYPCKIAGYRNLKAPKDTTILYCVLEKKDNAYEISTRALLEDRKLLEKFHPEDAVRLGFISCGDILFSEDTDEWQQKYHEVVDKITGV